MEQVIRFYGKFMIEGIVLFLMIIILFNGIGVEEGILVFAGKNVKIDSIDYNQYNDFKGTYQGECKKKVPEIFFVGTHLQSGNCIITDFIKAKDFTGTELQIKVISIKDAGGIELMSEYEQETGKIFLKPGIYTVEVSAVDEKNKCMKCRIQIPVSK